MEELGELIVAIIILVGVFGIKLMEMATRKKMPLPLPELPPEEELSEEFETHPQPQVEIKPIPQEPRPIPKVVISPPKGVPSLGLSIGELQHGIVLSTILGPPKAKARILLFSNNFLPTGVKENP